MSTNSAIRIKSSDRASFNNKVDFCVGTGRLGLGLTKEYLDQLEFVQREIGFKYIRGHGLFCDDVAIYHEYEKDGEIISEYNYTYIDRIFDNYLRLGIRPFLELGFMPYKMASGTQTVFYWKGNTTPPKEYARWCDMVKALLVHLKNRYGEEDVLTWPIEVWNEPNLPGFWEHADMQEYFKLFEYTFKAIKEVDSRFTVGGPAICGVDDVRWITEFMKFVSEKKLAIDFVTRHHYTVELPEVEGHYIYHKLRSQEEGFEELKATRDIVDSFDEYKGIPIHITEFNTSYCPLGVIHDTNLNAALLALQLSRLGDMNESYSYWTFGDVFEENGVPYTPFHGGFGMVANGCIPKPTFWTFAFYKYLLNETEVPVYKSDNMVVVSNKNGGYSGIVWNIDNEEDFWPTLELEIAPGKYTILRKTVDETTCNPLKVWHDIGEPANPVESQLELIRQAAKPFIATALADVDESGILSFAPCAHKNGVVYFSITKTNPVPDRGYDYEKVITYH